MRDSAASRSLRAEVRIDSGPGRRRAIGWPLARLVVSDDELGVRSRVPGWVPTMTARKDEIGEITVDHRFEIVLPVPHWRRRDIVTFAPPASPLAGIRVLLPRRARIADELRARGYQVTGR